MSTQQSEVRQNEIREVIADGMPPLSRRAEKRAAYNNDRFQRRSLAIRKRREEVAEAAALGVAVVTKLTVDRRWTEEEDNVLRALYPHHDQIRIRIPHRSAPAICARIQFLGFTPMRKTWTVKEVATLNLVWAQGTKEAICEALPRWSFGKICDKARHMDLRPRGQELLKLTGNALCDAIRDRCRVLGYSMKYLDRISSSGAYFQAREWKNKDGHRLTPMIRAVNALGGVLNVERPD